MSQHPVQRPARQAVQEEEVVAVDPVQVRSRVRSYRVHITILCVSPCSSSCSGGTRRRTRTCVGERGECYGR